MKDKAAARSHHKILPLYMQRSVAQTLDMILQVAVLGKIV